MVPYECLKDEPQVDGYYLRYLVSLNLEKGIGKAELVIVFIFNLQ